jgi:hypothetical protein
MNMTWFPIPLKNWCWLMAGMSLAFHWVQAQEIQRLTAGQRPGTFLVNIGYDLISPSTNSDVFISIEASGDNVKHVRF